jgi:hypothetical protein
LALREEEKVVEFSVWSGSKGMASWTIELFSKRKEEKSREEKRERESESEKRRNAKDLCVRPYRVGCQQADPRVVDPVGVRGCVMTMREVGREWRQKA